MEVTAQHLSLCIQISGIRAKLAIYCLLCLTRECLYCVLQQKATELEEFAKFDY